MNTSRRIATVALALGFPLVTGCGGSDPLTRIESTYAGMIDHICTTCPAAASSTTEAECRSMAAMNDPFAGAAFDCQRDAYNRFPNELGPYYDCVARGVSAFDSCMRNATRTCPPTSADVSACNDQFQSALRACPLPDSIMAAQAISACFSSP